MLWMLCLHFHYFRNAIGLLANLVARLRGRDRLGSKDRIQDMDRIHLDLTGNPVTPGSVVLNSTCGLQRLPESQ